MMTNPSWDAGELARAALSELTPQARLQLLVNLICDGNDLNSLAFARNAITDRASEIIADRYSDTMWGDEA